MPDVARASDGFPLPYEVRIAKHAHLRARPVAAFRYARDAKEYVESDAARQWSKSIDDDHPRAVRRDGHEGTWIELYAIEDYEIVDLGADGRRMVGVTGHGHAILESLRAAKRREEEARA